MTFQPQHNHRHHFYHNRPDLEEDDEDYINDEDFRDSWIEAYREWACCEMEHALAIWEEMGEVELEEGLYCECGEFGHNGDPQSEQNRTEYFIIENEHDRAMEHIASTIIECEDIPPRYIKEQPSNYDKFPPPY
jgi:hypothetical protein